MEFEKYCSLENTYRQKAVDSCHELDIRDWVGLEKVDGCFKGSTNITLPDGSSMRIKDIVDTKYTGPVLGVDGDGNLVETNIKNWHANGKTKDWLKVSLQSFGGVSGHRRVITCTPNHMFYSSGEYVAASELSVGDSVDFAHSGLALDSVQEQILIGKMLGDGSLNKNYVCFGHKEEHIDYVKYTRDCLGGFGGTLQKPHISGYGSTMSRSRSISSSYIEDLFSGWDKSVGYVPRLNLTPIILAFWYMDDGSVNLAPEQRPRPTFHVCNFSKATCLSLIGDLERIGVYSTLTGGEKRYTLTVSSSSADLLYSMIAPMVPEIMQYKLPEKYRMGDSVNGLVASAETRKAFQKSYALITGIEADNTTLREKYDIETGTHNYFANYIHVHNSHMSFLVDFEMRVSVASRNQVLEKTPEGVYDFYGCTEVVNSLKDDMRHIAHICEGPVRIYGEFFGSSVQKRIKYGEKRFQVFDIQTHSGEFLGWDIVKHLCNEVGIEHVPEIDRGTLTEMLDTSPEFTSKLCEDIAEGIVIKPLYEEALFGNGSRAILKQKSKAHSEKSSVPKKPAEPLSPELEKLYMSLSTYLTQNRLGNVLSKVGKVSTKDFGKVVGMLTKDAREDFEKEHYEISKEDWKAISKQVGKLASEVVRGTPHSVYNWLNIIDNQGSM